MTARLPAEVTDVRRCACGTPLPTGTGSHMVTRCAECQRQHTKARKAAEWQARRATKTCSGCGEDRTGDPAPGTLCAECRTQEREAREEAARVEREAEREDREAEALLAEAAALRASLPAPTPYYARPRLRSDCETSARPCTWASCRYHLAGELASCALDVVEDGEERSQVEIAALMGVTPQAVQQVEARALAKLQARGVSLRHLLPKREVHRRLPVLTPDDEADL